jgi:hypothetical protein
VLYGPEAPPVSKTTVEAAITADYDARTAVDNSRPTLVEQSENASDCSDDRYHVIAVDMCGAGDRSTTEMPRVANQNRASSLTQIVCRGEHFLRRGK